MKILGASINTHIPSLERHGLPKLIRHATDKVVGKLPFAPADRRKGAVEESVDSLNADFIDAQAKKLLGDNKIRPELNQIMQGDLDDAQKRAQIKKIVVQHVDERALKDHAVAKKVSSHVLRMARYELRQDPTWLQEQTAKSIFRRWTYVPQYWPGDRYVHYVATSHPLDRVIRDDKSSNPFPHWLQQRKSGQHNSMRSGISKMDNTTAGDLATIMEDSTLLKLSHKSTTANLLGDDSFKEKTGPLMSGLISEPVKRSDSIASRISKRSIPARTNALFGEGIVRSESPKAMSLQRSGSSGGNTIIIREYPESDDDASIATHPKQKAPRILMKVSLRANMAASTAARGTFSSMGGIPPAEAQAANASIVFKDEEPDLEHPISRTAMAYIHKVALAAGQEFPYCVLKEFKPAYQQNAWEEYDNNCYIQSRLNPVDGNAHIAKFLGPVPVEYEDEDEELLDHEKGSAQQATMEPAAEIFLAFEYIEGKHLGSLFGDLRERLPAPDILRLAQHVIYGAVHGLSELEKSSIAHNDIKPNNILFNMKTMQAKLIDFGNAAVHGHYRQFGNPAYTPPESLNTVIASSNPGASKKARRERTPLMKIDATDLEKIENAETDAGAGAYLIPSQKLRKEFRRDDVLESDRKNKTAPVTDKTDAFGIGQVLHSLVEGKEFYMFKEEPDNPASLLFQRAVHAESFKKRGQVFPDAEQTESGKIDAHYYDFVNKAMDPDAEKRYTCQQLLRHPFLQNRPSKAEVEEIFNKLDAPGRGLISDA